jgi:hypothetical protein
MQIFIVAILIGIVVRWILGIALLLTVKSDESLAKLHVQLIAVAYGITEAMLIVNITVLAALLAKDYLLIYL